MLGGVFGGPAHLIQIRFKPLWIAMNKFAAKGLTLFHVMVRKARAIRANFAIGVHAIVVNGDGHVLLVRHTYIDGWYLPGGGVKRRETLEAGLRRELREEVGVTFEGAPELFGTYSHLADGRSLHVTLFVVRGFQMDPIPNVEIAAWAFYPPDALPPGTSAPVRRRVAEFSGKSPRALVW